MKHPIPPEVQVALQVLKNKFILEMPNKIDHGCKFTAMQVIAKYLVERIKNG